MYEEHAKVICSSLHRARELRPGQELGKLMFEHFFERYPETRQIFADTDVPGFAATKFRIVSDFIIDCVKSPRYAGYYMLSEVCIHRRLDVKDTAYFYAMVECCRQAVEETLAEEWTQDTNTDWDDVIQATKATIQQAYREAA